MVSHLISDTSPNRELLNLILPIYETSFPADERRHFADVIRIAATESAFRAEIYTEGDVALGFILYWRFPVFIYAEHFAVSENVRGKGLGRSLFSRFLKQACLPVVLEVEKPEDATSIRRIRFYESLGMKLSTAPYLQPPYSADKHPVSLLLMSYGDIDLNKQMYNIETFLYRNVYRASME
jgi:GNAT superfamily N-acetyltransferase